MKNVFQRKRCYFIFLMMLYVSLTTTGQCIVAGPNNGSNFLNENSGSGSISFFNPSNAETFGNGKATASVTLGSLISESAQSSFLKATGFNFFLPGNAIVCGVTVEIRKRAIGINLVNSIRDGSVRLIKSGAISGDSKAKGENWTDTDTYYTYGGTADLWGQTLTPADVNDPEFGIAISAAFNGINTLSAEIDHISIAVSYNTPTVVLPLVVLDFKSSLDKDIATHQWKIAEVEPNSSIIVQRKKENSQWEDLKIYTHTYHQFNRFYTYRDTINEKEVYSYRLKLTSATGVVSYSKTNKLQLKNTYAQFILGPNPSSHTLYIRNANRKNSIFIYNNAGQLMNNEIEWLDDKDGIINIQKLPKGSYYLINGTMKKSFIKE